jgi:hypothetical protein
MLVGRVISPACIVPALPALPLYTLSAPMGEMNPSGRRALSSLQDPFSVPLPRSNPVAIDEAE